MEGHRLRNLAQTVLLFAGMLLILGLLGYLFGGLTGILWSIVVALPFMLFWHGLSPEVAMAMSGARRLSGWETPTVYRMVEALADQAGLSHTPQLYYIPNGAMNAFSVGPRDHAALALTDGMLRYLGPRELEAVLAHEIAHIGDNDVRVMSVATLIGRLTSLLATLGRLLFLVNLPLLLMGLRTFPWLGVLLLIAAPTLTNLLQLALSRSREFQADLGAVRLTGDPEALAIALQKMEAQQESLLRRFLLPTYQTQGGSLLRTHPRTEERVRRLLALRSRMVGQHANPYDAMPSATCTTWQMPDLRS